MPGIASKPARVISFDNASSNVGTNVRLGAHTKNENPVKGPRPEYSGFFQLVTNFVDLPAASVAAVKVKIGTKNCFVNRFPSLSLPKNPTRRKLL